MAEPYDEFPEPPPRSRRIRTARGTAGTEEGTPGGVNEAVASINRGRRASVGVPPLSDVDSSVGSAQEAPQDFTPYNRMRDVQSRSRATAYEKEYRLKLLHRMLLRNAPLDQIAEELGVNVRTVIRDRKELTRRLREASKKLDIHRLVGESIGFYQEVRGMSLRAASAAKVPLHIRLAAMRTALNANNDMHSFLDKSGVYDVLQYRAEDTAGDNDIQKFAAMIESLIDETDAVEKATKDELQMIADIDQDDIEIL